MVQPIPALLSHLLIAYAATGGAVGALFLVVGIERVEPRARGAYAFRPLLMPGLILLWPFVLVRWRAIERANRERI